MKVMVCGITNEKDIAGVIAGDVDAAGFQVGQLHKSETFILPSTAARLAEQLPPYVTPVIITQLKEATEIREILERSGIYCVQLQSGNSRAEVEKLHGMLPPHGKIILTYYAAERIPDAEIEDFYPFLDAIIFDCYNREPGLFEAPGIKNTYRWDLGAAFVKKCPLPVILSGGLTPENVKLAIAQVRPYGVAAAAGLKNDQNECSPEKCRRFVMNAKTASYQLE